MKGLAAPPADRLFAILASLYGLFLLIVTPPFGAGDEPAHFERIQEVRALQWLGAEGLPAGAVAFVETGYGKIRSEERIDAAHFETLRRIRLDAERSAPYPEPLRVVLRINSPLAYIHFMPAATAGAALQLDPFVQFYLFRLTSLAVFVLLIANAIRRLPGPKYLMALIALAPTALHYASAVSVDPWAIALSFGFFARLSAACDADGPMRRGEWLALAVFAFLLAQTKTPYALLPLAALLIPARRFAGPAGRARVVAAIALPGLAIALLWAGIVRSEMVDGLVYATGGGARVVPAEQFAGILADPLAYLRTFLSTLFSSEFIGKAWAGFIAAPGWAQIAAAPFVHGAFTAALLLVFLNDDTEPDALVSAPALAFRLALFAVALSAALTLLYLQWTGVGAARIEGFQGRYLYPLAPLLFAARPIRMTLFATPLRRASLVATAATIAVGGSAGALIAAYYG